jgi:glutamate-1-semialdehyde 2,1-aminomutase
MQRAEGAYLYDADGNRYLDYIGSWGPMLLGHAYPPVVQAVQAAAANSTSFGAPTEVEIQMAELIRKMVPGVDRVRMVNSGTEACMSAIRVARGYTGRNKIVKFAGCYHGHGDSFLIKAGSGALTLGHPNSPGVTPGTAQDTLLANYNDLAGVQALFAANPGEIAALIIEPVPGNMGCILPQPGFLEGLSELCTQHGTVLIFDEVMTGFRLAPGGVQERLGVVADMVTLGKIVGAGLPVGAFAGKQAIMDCVAPVGPVYQAGTLSGNPLAMHAGLALLTELHQNPAHYTRLDELGAQLKAGLHAVFQRAGVPYRINHIGSMLSFHFCDVDVIDFDTACQSDQTLFAKVFHTALANGVYLAPSAFESLFLSAALTPANIDHTCTAIEKAFV